MSVASAIARFRAKQAEQFTTTATVHRLVGEPTFDDDTQEFDQDYDLIYTGPCKIRPDRNRSADDVDAGETLVGRPDFDGKFPVDSDIQRDDVVTVTGSAFDPGMVGRTYTVRKAQNDEWQISRAVTLEETLVPLLNGGS